MHVEPEIRELLKDYFEMNSPYWGKETDWDEVVEDFFHMLEQERLEIKDLKTFNLLKFKRKGEKND